MERRVSKRELYNYFKKYSVELTDMDKQVINMLFKRLSEERQARIQGYIDGVYHQREKAGRNAAKDLQLLQYQFMKYQETKMSSNEILYRYFSTVKKELTLEDKEVIDALISTLSKDNQQKIIQYIRYKHHQLYPVDEKTYKVASLLKNKFKKYVETSKFPEEYKKMVLYQYFASIKENFSEEDKEILNTLLKKISLERRNRIVDYLKGKISHNSDMNKVVAKDLQLLQRKFEQYPRNRSNIKVEGNYLKKVQVLLEAMKVIEESFYQLGFSEEEYRKYKLEKEQKIRERGIISFEDVMSTFITESYYCIKAYQERKTL